MHGKATVMTEPHIAVTDGPDGPIVQTTGGSLFELVEAIFEPEPEA